MCTFMFVILCVCVCMYACTHTHMHRSTRNTNCCKQTIATCCSTSFPQVTQFIHIAGGAYHDVM